MTSAHSLRRAFVLLIACWLGLSGPAFGQVEPGAAAEAAAQAPEAEAEEAAAQEEPPEPTPQDELREQLVAFTRLRTEISALIQQIDTLEGEERASASFQARERWLEAMRVAHGLANQLARAEAAELDMAELRPQVEEALEVVSGAIPALLDRGEERLVDLRKQREVAEGEAAEAIDTQIARILESRADLDRQYLDHIADLEKVGMDSETARNDLANRLQARAEKLAGRLQLAAERLAEARIRAAATPDDASRAEAARVAEVQLDRVANSLKESVGIMASLELDTARYKRLLIESTGEISGAIFDREVAAGLLEQWTENAVVWARSNAPTVVLRVLLFAVVLMITGLVARLTRHVVERGVNTSRTRMTQLAREMVINISGRIVWILGLLVAVSQLGIEIGPLLAGLGVAGFIIGFALQDTLGNFASGAMLLIYRPYDVGDLVEVAGGVFGNVSKQSLVSTTILTIDNQTLVIPNSKIWGDVIKNVTAQRLRRVDMKFGIAYSDDIQHAEKIFASILKEHPKVLADPEPNVRLHELGDSSVNFIVRPWVKTDDYWDVYWDVTREVKLRLDREGLSIPFPQRDVHFHPEAVAPKAGTSGSDADFVQSSAGRAAGDVDGTADDD
ncbi:MAG: mechanosensitive ion channel domain-containing protein [Myxococcota bacterium]